MVGKSYRAYFAAALLLPLLLSAGLLCVGCKEKEKKTEARTFRFKDLVLSYPASHEVADLEEVPEVNVVSLNIRKTEIPGNRLELVVSTLPMDMMQNLPVEEAVGELVADVTETVGRLTGMFSVVDVGKVQLSGDGALPAEAWAVVTMEQEGGGLAYVRAGSKMIPPYHLKSVAWAGDREELDVLTGVLDSAEVPGRK